MTLLFINTDARSRGIRGGMLRIYVPYFIIAYALALLVPAQLKFMAIIGLILFGYVTMNVFFARCFLNAHQRRDLGSA